MKEFYCKFTPSDYIHLAKGLFTQGGQMEQHALKT
jgi:hypothetical protein